VKTAQILETLEFFVSKDQQGVAEEIPTLDLGDGLQTLKRLQDRVLLQHESALKTGALPQSIDLCKHVVLGCFETVACCVFADTVSRIKTIQQLKRRVPANQHGAGDVSTNALHAFSRGERTITINGNRHSLVVSTNGSEAGKSIDILQCIVISNLHRSRSRLHSSETLDI
jgi:hypothetical protein